MNETYLVEIRAYTYVEASDRQEAVDKVLDAMNRDYVEKGEKDGDGVFFKDIGILNLDEASTEL